MNSLSSRVMLISVVMALFLMPLYAHHGNQFLSVAMEMNAAEVRLGEMAINKSRNATVKAFAEMLVKDHNDGLNKLMELRSARTITRATYGTLVADQGVRGLANIHRNAADIPLTNEDQSIAERLSLL